MAEQWGRRWITCDTSRVPLALARQRLLTATFPWYELKEPARGPAGGFVYKRKQNKKGEEVGGLVPRITLKSIANAEDPETVTLVDRPEVNTKVTRVCGRFTVEGTVQAARSVDDTPHPGPLPGGEGEEWRVADAPTQNEKRTTQNTYPENPRLYLDRMIEVLRQSHTLRLPENETLGLEKVRALSGEEFEHLQAEAVLQNGKSQRVGIVFGPEHSAIDSSLVIEAHREAYSNGFDLLCLFGFAIEAKARELIGSKRDERRKLKLRCIYVNVTPDVVMSDLLKTSKSSEVFSVTGLPDVEVFRFEFLVFSGGAGERYVHWPTFSQLSGFDRLAEVHGLGAADLHLYALLSQGRAVWRYLADAAGWDFASGQYRGRTGTEQHWGVSAIPWDRSGLPRGIGDFDHDLRALGLHSLADCRRAIDRLRLDPAVARSLDAIAKNEKLETKNCDHRSLHQVRLLGLDIFRPRDLETESIAADNLPCWMLDTDYNGMVFMARQVFFPKTSAWDNLEKSLRGRFADGVWAHLAGTESEPFAAGTHRQIAVKVIDERGNELMVVKGLRG